MTSPVRWTGSKRWFSDYRGGQIVLDHLDRSGGRYVEPFLGGGNMAFFVGARYSKPLHLSDVVEPLIEFYQALQNDPVQLAYTIAQIGIEYGLDEKAYYAVRDEEPPSALLRAARFVYLNSLGFNGLWRENANGKYNVPCGSRAKEGKAKLPERKTFELASKSLQLATIECCDFEAVIDRAGRNDLIYCDPPYHYASGEGFTDYAKGGFGVAEQERLALALYRASERGATFLAHNSLERKGDEDGVQFWYSEFAEVIPFDEPRRVAANGDRDDAKCCLITNAPGLAEKLRYNEAA